MFKFKGISSTDMQVIIEEEEHFIARAAKRYETIEIEGRDGAIFNELGYSYVERPIYVQCLNIDKIDDILAWLDGEGEFEYKERKTIARFYSELDPQREGYIRIIDANFIRNPFWIKADDELVTVKESKSAETEESKSLNITDASQIPAQLNVEGNQKQETREGYNLYDYINNISTSRGGLTIQTQEDGYIIVNGTPTYDYVSITNNSTNITNLLDDGETYTLWQEVYTGNLKGLYLQVTAIPINGSSASQKYYNSSSPNSTFVVDKENYTYNANIQIATASSAGTLSNYKNRYMLYKGTDDKTFELYGASPSPNYPSPVISLGSNKNFFNKDAEGILKNTWISQDGNTGTSSITNTSDYIDVKGKKYITINYDKDNNSRQICFYDSSKQVVLNSLGNLIPPYSVEIPETVNYIKFSYYNKANNVKVEEGKIATSYSPYEQGSTEIKKINKNFLISKEIDTTINGVKIVCNNGVVTLDGKATGSVSFDFDVFSLKKGIYKNTRGVVSGKATGSFQNYLRNEDGSYFIQENESFELQEEKKLKYRFFANPNSVFEKYTMIPQVEKGLVSTTPETHKEKSKILPIQQEMLTGDYFVKEIDGWKELHNWKKYIFTGDEGFGAMGNGLFYSSKNVFFDAKLPNSNSIPAEIYCNCFKSESYNKTWGGKNDNSIALNVDGTNNPRIYCTKITTATELKNILQQKNTEGNPIYAYYKTTTPTKLPCTEEQIAVLEELNNLELFKGTNNIITTEDIALLKLIYIQQTNEKIDNEGNIESRPILRLEKTIGNSVELTINNCRFKYNFNDEEYVEIDCEEKAVIYEGLNRNRQIEIGYEFPILNVGENDIIMHSGDCIIKVLRKDRWL